MCLLDCCNRLWWVVLLWASVMLPLTPFFVIDVELTVMMLAAGKLKLLPQIDLTPEMHVAFNTLHVAGMLRVTLTPIMQVTEARRHTVVTTPVTKDCMQKIMQVEHRAQHCNFLTALSLQDVPFVGGVSLSWLEMPMIDFDIKCVSK